MNSPESRVSADVKRFGWHCISIADVAPQFLYTVGLMKTFDHPEAIIFGLERDVAHDILSVFVANIRNGSRYESAGKHDNVLDGSSIGIRAVDSSHHETYLGYAMGFCREIGRIGELQAIQLFWPDSDGLFPFEPKCDLGIYNCQPRLDIPLSRSDCDELDSEF